MEVGQGPNWGCSTKEKKMYQCSASGKVAEDVESFDSTERSEEQIALPHEGCMITRKPADLSEHNPALQRVKYS
jgi:hypothetical protein